MNDPAYVAVEVLAAGWMFTRRVPWMTSLAVHGAQFFSLA